MFASAMLDLNMAEHMAKGGRSRGSEDAKSPSASAGAAEVQPAGTFRDTEAHPGMQTRDRLRRLYEGRTRRAHRFRYGLLIFDIVTLVFVVATSFMERNLWIEVADVAFGLLILADFLRPVADLRQAVARVPASGDLGRHGVNCLIPGAARR
jgi:hypothetical protein